VRSDGARPGDALLLTKGIAVEGTAIIAREMPVGLVGLDESLLERCRGFLYDPGISVVRDAAVATAAGKVHAMHDPTEGGLATGLWELAEAAGVALEVDEDAVPVFPETRVLCAQVGLDPLGLIASGALLLAVASEDAASILTALKRASIAAARIGHVVEQENLQPGATPSHWRVVLRSETGSRPLPRFERDEIAHLFD